MDKLTGHNKWHKTVIAITQKGSRNWSGKVKVWNNLSGKYKGIHGRREPYSDSGPGQWAVGDKIKLTSCKKGMYISKYIERRLLIQYMSSYQVYLFIF